MENFKNTANVSALYNVLELVEEFQKNGSSNEIKINLIPHNEKIDNCIFAFKHLISYYDDFKKKWMYTLIISVNDKEFKITDASFKNVLLITKNIIDKNK